MLSWIRSVSTRLNRKFRRNRDESLPFNTEDMSRLNSVSPRCLHKNDKRLIQILLAAACFSVFLQKTIVEVDPSIAIRRSEAIMNARVFFTPNHTADVGDHDTTVVTAFFDIGPYVTRNKFFQFAERFEFLENPLIVFTDSEPFATHMQRIRNSTVHRTRIVIIDRNSSWAFKLKDSVENIFSNNMFPKSLPNTETADYACAQFAKYDVLARAARDNFFNSKYFAWVDIDYFRERELSAKFYLTRPPDFNENQVAVTLINSTLTMSAQPEMIFKNSLVWVEGGLTFGKQKVILKFEKTFKSAVKYFISKGLANTDQQVTYAMYSKEGRRTLNPDVQLQIYRPFSEGSWYYLGELMTHEMS
ncbi:protein HtrL-like [Mya arenaria]|uniref:protein HtrL-like n=1 Tax=Mya arenaria TaxID=6604 RepID=UPI0022E1FC23|nr:protein HtrL-like [Mya arenaria]